MKKTAKKTGDDDEDGAGSDRWLIVKDLLNQLIEKAKGWEDATLIASRQEMAKVFNDAYPEQFFVMEDLRLALHDLNISYERNEHNSKFYYLANWK